MAIDIKKIFQNIPYVDPSKEASELTALAGRTGSQQQLGNFKFLQVGNGTKSFKVAPEGQWMGAEKFADATYSVDMQGNVILNSVLINGRAGDVIAGSIDENGNFINDLISDSLNSLTQRILGEYKFTGSGAIAINIDANNGLFLSPTGILGKKAGVTTFAVDTAGNATFGGTLVAASGTFGTITAGTMTGVLIQSQASGRRVRLQAGTRLEFLDGNNVKGFMEVDGSGRMLLDADTSILLQANGAGDDITLLSGDDVTMTAIDFFFTASGNWQINEADEVRFNFNSDNDGDDVWWTDRGDNEMSLKNNGDLYIDGSYFDSSDGGADFAEYFESVGGEEIPKGIPVILDGDKIRPALAGEIPIGVISATASFIGNAGGANCGTSWGGKYLKNDFGEYVTEEVEWWTMHIIEEVEKTKGKFKKRKRRVSGYSDEKPAPKGAKKKMVMRKKINPDWNKNEKYITRKDRPEWNIVGLLGRLRVLKGKPTNPNWIKLRDINDSIEEWLVK